MRREMLPVVLVMGLLGPSVAALAADSPPSQPPVVGLRKQLLVDDYVIAEKTNVTRELGQPVKANEGKPLVVKDKPWEDFAWLYGTVLRDGDKFRMWYRIAENVQAYAESRDGLKWEKPILNLVNYKGGKANNVFDGVRMGASFSCFIDPHETDLARKYKACYCGKGVKATLAYSADGLAWIPYNNGNPVTGRAADTYNQLLWDEDAKLYRMITREDYKGTIENRGIRLMTNPDVNADPTNWTTVRKFVLEDYKRRQIYGMTDWIYEGVHFGLFMTYEYPTDMSEGGRDTKKRHERDIFNFYIGTCRDGVNFDLSWLMAEKPLIPRGPSGSFDKDWVFASSQIITFDDKHWIYYGGGMERHGPIDSPDTGGIGLATLRLDGFVCLTAGEKPGVVVTRPFTLEGANLALNLDAKGGEARVEVLDEAGQPLPGFTAAEAALLKGEDSLRIQPAWKGQADLSSLKGKVIRLRFHLKNAKLYAFQVRP